MENELVRFTDLTQHLLTVIRVMGSAYAEVCRHVPPATTGASHLAPASLWGVGAGAGATGGAGAGAGAGGPGGLCAFVSDVFICASEANLGA